jgi:hypothetical protein
MDFNCHFIFFILITLKFFKFFTFFFYFHFKEFQEAFHIDSTMNIHAIFQIHSYAYPANLNSYFSILNFEQKHFLNRNLFYSFDLVIDFILNINQEESFIIHFQIYLESKLDFKVILTSSNYLEYYRIDFVNYALLINSL